MVEPLNYLSLFSGIGGIDLGLDRAGMNCVGQVEIDPFCNRVLARHWPDVDRHDDVRTAVRWWDRVDRPQVHAVVGGPPCQPFSNSGKKGGTGDERWMWPQFIDVVRHVGPRYVIVENVAGIINDDDAFGTILADLDSCGFDAVWSVLRACDFGAPHVRERLYLVAYPPLGVSGDLLELGGEGPPPFPAGGIPGLAVAERRQAQDDWLAREPGVDRLAHGLPDQLDRLYALGNAVVPAMAEHLGRLIVEFDGRPVTPVLYS